MLTMSCIIAGQWKRAPRRLRRGERSGSWTFSTRSRQSSRPLEDYYYISDETDIESDYIKGEQNIILHQALGALGKDYSQVLYLIYFEGLTAAEAARIMGRTSRQVSDLIYRAKKALRAELERRGFNGQI